MVSNLSHRRVAAKVRIYRCATSATMLMMLAQSLGAGKKWS